MPPPPSHPKNVPTALTLPWYNNIDLPGIFSRLHDRSYEALSEGEIACPGNVLNKFT